MVQLRHNQRHLLALFPRGIRWVAAAWALLSCCLQPTHAQQRNVDPRYVFEDARPLNYANKYMTHLGRGPLDRVMEPISASLSKLEEKGGPSFIAYYTQMFQNGSQGGADNWTINHELDSYAQLKVCESPRFGSGKVYAYFYHLQDNFTGTDTVMFSDALGSAWLANYGDADGVFDSLDVLVWEQSWREGDAEFLIGQIDPGVFFDLNLFAGDDTGYFYSEPLATNPVRAFPLAGLGMMGTLELTSWLTVLGAITDADADGRYPDFSSLSDDSWLYVGELVLKPLVGGARGNYRITYYQIDATETNPRGRGVSLSFDQPVGENRGLFFRFAQADGRRRALRKFVNAGVVRKGVIGWKDDQIGLGFVWGQPTDRSQNDQYGMELFWRLQLTARLQFSPDIQVIFDPSQTTAREMAAVGGMRVRWIF